MFAKNLRTTLIIFLLSTVVLPGAARSEIGFGASLASPSLIYVDSPAIAETLSSLLAPPSSRDFYAQSGRAYVFAAGGWHIGIARWEGGRHVAIPGPDYAILRASHSGLELGRYFPRSRSTLGLTIGATRHAILRTHLREDFEGDPDDTLTYVLDHRFRSIEFFATTQFKLLSFLGLNMRIAYHFDPIPIFASNRFATGLVFSASLIVGKLQESPKRRTTSTIETFLVSSHT